MLDDTRLDGKLQDLTRELKARQLIPGFTIADAFTTQGMDETGRPGLFAAILLAPSPTPELGVLTLLRQMLTARLKQLDTRTPAFPIVVQGAPEVIDSHSVVPGGREAFEQVKLELLARRERLRPNRAHLIIDLPGPAPVEAAPAARRTAAKRKPAVKVKKARTGSRLSAKTVTRAAARSRR
jgi:hypothetical protein